MTHEDHAQAAYRYQDAAENASKRSMNDLAESQMVMAQWHATMAVYELSLKNARIK